MIFGSDGFIGSEVARTFDKEHEVYRATRSLGEGPTIVDLLKPESILVALTSIKPEVIVNCAGVIENSAKANLNIKMSMNLLEQIVISGIDTFRTVLLGSAGEYGVVSKLPVQEDDPISPKSIYAEAKAQEIKQALNFAENNNIPVVIARVFNPIGKGMNNRLLLPQLVTQSREISQGKRGAIVVSRKDAKRDYIPVADLAEAIKSIATLPANYAIYNVGTGISTSTEDLIKHIYRISGIKNEISIIETSDEPEQLMAIQANIDRLKEDFNWAPKQTVEDVIKEIIND
jgi:GDP-4-dehydro-6-deoxy-D-mannose reductase